MGRITSIGLAMALLVAARLSAQTPAHDGVRRAALDYLEGFYQGDSTKFLRGVRSDFYKIGFWRPRDSTRYAGPERMTWAEALGFIRNVREKKQFAPPTSPKEVAILEVLDQTAAAKVTAWWGTDFLLMGKFDGQWMITHVLWQSPPPKRP